MPKTKSKCVPPQLEFVNPPYSKHKSESNYKICSELYPEVKKTFSENASHWCEAPTPNIVPCTHTLHNRPQQYGIEYHGFVTRQETEKLLDGAPDGSFLIRDSQRAENAYTLVILFDKVAKNFKLFYDITLKQHYVGETKFDTIGMLVADGLIHFYVETRGSDVLKKIAEANTYEKTPFYKTRYHTFNAQALDSSFKPKLDDHKILDSDDYLLSSSFKHLKVLEHYKMQSKRILSNRRQSADAGLSDNLRFASPRLKPLISDWLVVSDRQTNGMKEVRNYRDYPPLASHQQIYNHPSHTNNINSSLSLESGFSNFTSKQTNNVHTGIKCSANSQIITTAATLNNSGQPVTSIVSGSHIYNRQQINIPISDDASLINNQMTINSRFTPHQLHCKYESSINTLGVGGDYLNQYNDFLLLTSSSNFNPSIGGDQDSPDKSGLSHAPLATCYSGESSSSIDESCSTASSSCDSLLNHKRHLSKYARPSNVNLKFNEAEDGGTNPSPNHKLSFLTRVPDKFNDHCDSNCPIQMKTPVKMDNHSGLMTHFPIDKDAMLKMQERYNLPVACLPPDSSNLISEVKAHNFKVHTYIGPHWCDYCTHFIWGLVAQGVKCCDCGFQAHKRCADRVPCDCIPDMKQMKRVFGVDLTNLTRAENKLVPTLLVRCVREIEQRGDLTCEGLYRVPGNHDSVEELRVEFDKDSELANISKLRISDTNTLTSLIKSFLRQLPVPLITYEVYPDLIDLVRNEHLVEKDKVEALRKVISRLPFAHFETLRFFISHIYRVSEHHETNMMTASNLAIILSPTLMSSSYTDPISCLAGTRFEHALISLLIGHSRYIFSPSAHVGELVTSNKVLGTQSPPASHDNTLPKFNHSTPHANNNRFSQIINSELEMIHKQPLRPLSNSTPNQTPFQKKWGFLRNKSLSNDTKPAPPHVLPV